MGNRMNCVGQERSEVTQEHETNYALKDGQPDLTLNLAHYEDSKRKGSFPDMDTHCNKFLTPELWDEYKNKKCEHGISFKTCIMAGAANGENGIGVYAGSPSSYKTFRKFFDKVIQDYHGHGPDERHHTDMSALGLEKTDFAENDAALVNSTIISVERNFEGFPLGPGVLKMHRLQIMDLVFQACEKFQGDLKGTFYPLEGMTEEVQNQLQAEDLLFNRSSSISVFKDDQWEAGRAVFHNRDKSLLIWVNEKDHVRISAMCQGVDIGATFDRLCRAVTHIEQGCKFAHDRHLGYFTSCPTNLGTALLASVLLSLPRLKKNREVFESIVDQYQLKVSGFEPEQDAEETNDISESKQEIDASKIEEAVVPEPQKKEEEDTILCISNKICLGRSERQLVQDMINCVHELIDAELEREKDEAPIDKNSVARLPLSLPSIKEVLTKAFGDFDTVHMRNIVVAIGNTGCGKSTLLSSMVLGPEALAQRDIVEMVTRKKNGQSQQVERKRKVIDYKDQENVVMPIGHQLEKSETFFPILIKSQTHDFSYVDIAGLQDTGGSIMEYVNQFINKKIFSMADKIRFLIPFTRDQIYDARGVAVAEQVTILLNIFHGDLAKMSKSIQPVVTKVRTNDDEFDIDHCRETLGRILEVLLENFMSEHEITPETIAEIEKMKTQDKSSSDDGKAPPNTVEADRSLTDKFVIYQKYKDLEAFFIDFKERLVLADPLDREICGSNEENQATSVRELVMLVNDLPPLQGKDLFVPLSDDKYHKLIDMFQRENIKVADEGCRFLDYVKNTKKFEIEFSQNQVVRNMMELIDFFIRNQLIEDIDQEMEKLNNYVNSIQQQVHHEKLRNEVGDVGKFLLDNVKFIIQRRKEKNYNSMVKKMIDVVVRLKNLATIAVDESSIKKLEDTKQKAHYFFKKLMDDVLKRHHELFVFAYELRMQDTFDSPPDYFTNYFFHYIINDIDPVILQLILSNKCIDGKLYVKQEASFQLQTGPDFKHIFKFNPNEVNSQPFVIKDPSTTKIDQINKERKSMGFFSKTFNNFQKNLIKRFGEGEHNIQFLLHPQGFIIQRDGKRLLTKKIVQENGAVQVMWADASNCNYEDTKYVIWTFRKSKKFKNAYHIEQLYGEVKPRLMCNKEDPQLWTGLCCNRKKSQHYDEACWVLKKNEMAPKSPLRNKKLDSKAKKNKKPSQH